MFYTVLDTVSPPGSVGSKVSAGEQGQGELSASSGKRKMARKKQKETRSRSTRNDHHYPSTELGTREPLPANKKAVIQHIHAYDAK